MRQIRLLLYVLLASLAIACEKSISAEDDSPAALPDGNLKLSIFQLEQTPFSVLTRTTVADVCTRLNFAIYDLDGNRLEQINQKVEDANFGTATFKLSEGSYQLIVLAHSSNGNPTMTNPSKIQFSNSQGYSDTFLYHTIVTVGDELQTIALSLRRIVALCRFVITDDIPVEITRLEFTYKGGSGHFDAKTGLGVTNSTQVVNFDVLSSQWQYQYDLYTFLHNIEGTIHLKVTAYDADDNPQHEREFDVPMEQNKITWLMGDFFIDKTMSTSRPLTTTVTVDNVWSGEQYLTY